MKTGMLTSLSGGDNFMKFEGVQKKWERYKYVVVIVLIGVVLLLWPSGKEEKQVIDDASNTAKMLETRDLESEMEAILGRMSGVGQVQVLLTLEADGERHLAQDTELSYSGDTAAPEDYSRRSETILVDGDSGSEAVVTKRIYPVYRGALVVCQGGGNAEVQLAVTKAVAALTGLTADRITVAKCQ